MRNTRDRRATAKGTRWGRTVQAGSVGPGRVRLSRRSVVGRAPGALPGPARRRRDLDGAHHPGRRQRAPRDWPRPGPIGRGSRRTGTSSPQAMRVMAGLGLAHGDLSAFNLLATEERIVLIDLPQAVDIVSNPQGMEFLTRDCRNVADVVPLPGAGGRRRRSAGRPDGLRLVNLPVSPHLRTIAADLHRTPTPISPPRGVDQEETAVVGCADPDPVAKRSGEEVDRVPGQGGQGTFKGHRWADGRPVRPQGERRRRRARAAALTIRTSADRNRSPAARARASRLMAFRTRRADSMIRLGRGDLEPDDQSDPALEIGRGVQDLPPRRLAVPPVWVKSSEVRPVRNRRRWSSGRLARSCSPVTVGRRARRRRMPGHRRRRDPPRRRRCRPASGSD